ncbi:MAG TPA: hypothetical protein PLM79_06850 [Syntrophobacteraceae bacterium]|mgnify:FL=1|nr:hypothetical protein [Syntrophobacteraceae bacterium]
MEECKECELAVYCYSDPSAWVFRTKQEMDEKQAAIRQCPVSEKAQNNRTLSPSASGQVRAR